MSPANTPVVFVHGQWLHASSWDLWVDLFREEGYAPQAPGWPGDSDTAEETRRHPERVAGKGEAAGGNAKMRLSEVPSVLLSECWNDLRQIAAEGPGFDPDWEKKTQM